MHGLQEIVQMNYDRVEGPRCWRDAVKVLGNTSPAGDRYFKAVAEMQRGLDIYRQSPPASEAERGYLMALVQFAKGPLSMDVDDELVKLALPADLFAKLTGPEYLEQVQADLVRLTDPDEEPADDLGKFWGAFSMVPPRSILPAPAVGSWREDAEAPLAARLGADIPHVHEAEDFACRLNASQNGPADFSEQRAFDGGNG